MKIILLSGGSGKRLFPLSNDVRAKQFLRLFSNEENKEISMVQRVYGQLKNIGLEQDVYVSTNTSQLDIMQNQLGKEVPMIIEPELRDTFPAISLATSYLYSEEKIEENEVVCVAPVDSFVDDSYFHKLKELEEVIRASNADIGLLGVTPSEPSEKFGYIIPKGHGSVMDVAGFSEKPTAEKAKELIDKNALWNCGVFAFKLGYMMNLLREKGVATEYPLLRANYRRMKKISFDYEVVEKAKHIKVLPYTGTWKDLGTWETLTEEIQKEVIGKGFVGGDSQNTNLINELEIPITVLGLKDVIVVASPDGILVSDKETSSRIKELITFEKTRPMFEERRWGWYRVLGYDKNEDGKEVLTKKICVKAGKNLSYQVHNHRSEVWTITAGEGEFVHNNNIIRVSAGDVLQIKLGDKHAIRADKDIEFIEVQTGSELVEEDIIRLAMTWEEIMEMCRKQKEETA